MKLKSTLIYSICVAYILIQTGCASIISPEKGTNTLTTEPPNAEVYDGNNVKLGNTPFNLSTVSHGVRMLKIKLDGYQDTELGINRRTKNGILFLDAMLLCIPCPFDLESKDLYTVNPVDPIVRLRKKMSEKENALKVAIDKVYLDSKSTVVGKINSKFVKVSDANFSRTIGSVDDQDEMVKAAFTNSSFEPFYISQVDNIKSNMGRPRVLIKPVIRNINVELKGKSLKYYSGTENIEMDWKIFKMSDKSNIIATINTTTKFIRNAGKTDRILDELIFEATNDFLENDTLYYFLQKLDKEYMSSTKGSVVNISTGMISKYTSTKDALRASKQAVVTVISSGGFGSGFLISPDGFLLTNYHVIKDEKNITVKLNSDVKMKATVIKSNKEFDLALLKIEAEDLKTISFSNSEKAEAGDEVYAIGTPMDESLGQSVTKGIISGEREINGVRFLQTDVSINPGNSGGPIINENGELVGITTMKLSGEGVEGIGFCIHSNTVIEMLNIKLN